MKMVLGGVAIGLALAQGAAQAADVSYFTNPLMETVQRVSAAVSAREYKLEAARHFYAVFASRVFKGRLPPLIHAVVVVETTVEADGRASEVKVLRGPSHAPDVTAAVLEAIRTAGPLPVPAGLGGGFKFTEIWLVHKDGRFQLDSLTEGQN